LFSLFVVSPDRYRAGTTEEYIGSWLAKNPARRAELVLATKACGFFPASPVAAARVYPAALPTEPPLPDCRLDGASVRAACEASLRRLQARHRRVSNHHDRVRRGALPFGSAFERASGSRHRWTRPHERAASHPRKTVGSTQHANKTWHSATLRRWLISRLSALRVSFFCAAQTDYIDLYQLHWPDRYVPIFGAQSYSFESERDGAVVSRRALSLSLSHARAAVTAVRVVCSHAHARESERTRAQRAQLYASCAGTHTRE
jgi:hypothetical protein